MSVYKAKNIPVIRLDEVDSTQQTAREWMTAGRIKEETVITARYQRAGKGRGTNTWDSEKGKNLLLTWVLFPDFLRPERQFALSVALSLALTDLLSFYVPEESVKWPNDIYAGDKKIAGILIDHDIRDDRILATLAGVGFNVNQTVFPPSLPNPVSLKSLTGKEYNPEEVLERFIPLFGKRYKALKEGYGEEQRQEYITRLFLYDKERTYRTPAGEIRARITGVDRYGRLLLTDEKGKTKAYGTEEVSIKAKGSKAKGKS